MAIEAASTQIGDIQPAPVRLPGRRMAAALAAVSLGFGLGMADRAGAQVSSTQWQRGQLTSAADMKLHLSPVPHGEVIANFTVPGSAWDGWLAVYPCADGWQGTSNLNFPAAKARATPNAAIVPSDANGDVCVKVSSPVDVIADVAGVAAPGTFGLLPSPRRIMDTRQGTRGKVLPGKPLEVAVPGAGSNSAAVTNLTVTRPDGSGFITAYPCDKPIPGTSSVNFGKGETVANLAVTRTGAGKICVASSVAADVIVDLAGVADATKLGVLPSPQRLVDTRNSGNGLSNSMVSASFVLAGGRRDIINNLTGTQASSSGWVSEYPGGSAFPGTSSTNFDGLGDTSAGMVLTTTDEAGKVSVMSNLSRLHIITDKIAEAPVGTYGLYTTPTRPMDTRTGQAYAVVAN